MRVAELGLVHRYEAMKMQMPRAGARRQFTQDDAHYFLCAGADRAGEPSGVINLVQELYRRGRSG